MNIDQMKSAWQQQPQLEVDNNRWGAMLQEDSHNPLAKLKKRTRMELIGSAIIHTGIAIFFLLTDKMQLATIAYVLMGAYSFYYTSRQLQLLKQMESLSGAVKQTIHLQVATMENYFRRHAFYAALTAPGLLIFLGYLIYQKTGELPVEDFPSTFPEAVLPYTGLVLLITVLLYVTGRISTKMKYGALLQQLKTKAAQFNQD